jgi:hypothetical protein
VFFVGPVQGQERECTLRPVKFRLFLLALFACSGPKRPPFSWPKNSEDVRAKLLVYIPEGREIEGARQWMAEHQFACDPPLPSATDAHAHLCHADPSAPADAGWRAWTVVLYERRGRLADVSVR